MKAKPYKVVVILFIAALAVLTLAACNRPVAESVYLVIDGDIEGYYLSINLAEMQKESYIYEEDGTQMQGEGWNLNTVLSDITMLYPDNRLMITAADGVSAIIDYPLTSSFYIYEEESKLCAKGLNYPRATGIKNISEITIITTNEATEGYKVLEPDSTLYVSRGNAKLKLFDYAVTNSFNGNTADKYTSGIDTSVSAFTGKNKNIVYLEDYDIIKNASLATLIWCDGSLYCTKGLQLKAVFGFATGTDKLIQDGFYDMKSALDEDKKVMFILPDGFSWEQAEAFSQDLTTLKVGENTTVAASTHLSISPVALAAMVSGQSPYINGVHFDEGESRAVLPLAVDDIFKYATDAGKSVSYIEGSGNLILTSVTPQYSLSDYMAYQNALQAVNEGKDLIFVHFHETDDINHQYGPLSSQAKTKLLITESYIEDLISGFSGTVIVVPDHGHNTLYDDLGNVYGKHGMFTAQDMYVPYYIFGD